MSSSSLVEADVCLQRIHVESLTHVLDQIGSLLSVGELAVRFYSTSAGRRGFELLPGEKPFRRGSPARRHRTPTFSIEKTDVTSRSHRKARLLRRWARCSLVIGRLCSIGIWSVAALCIHPTGRHPHIVTYSEAVSSMLNSLFTFYTALRLLNSICLWPKPP